MLFDVRALHGVLPSWCPNFLLRFTAASGFATSRGAGEAAGGLRDDTWPFLAKSPEDN